MGRERWAWGVHSLTTESEKRRARLWHILRERDEPITGTELATHLQVSRQVIVQDVALLRAQGKAVIATPRGYLSVPTQNTQKPRRTVAVKHSRELAVIEKELTAIVDEGGHVLDVIVEHPFYGELRGILMLQSRRDVRQFLTRMQETGAEPLSTLTEGVHLHTIEADTEEELDEIERVLDKLGFTEANWESEGGSSS